MKIALYAISKNEEQFVKRFCESAKDAEVILIGDTGSTDDTVGLARECGASVAAIRIKPWRFDKAREAVLALLPDDVDVCISLDLDEVMEPGWREEIERVWTADTTRLRYKFDWGCGIAFFYEKIHHRHGYFGIILAMSTQCPTQELKRFGRTQICFWLATTQIRPNLEASTWTCSMWRSRKILIAHATPSITPVN